MIRHKAPLLAAAIAVASFACGYTDSGDGTRTLQVVAELSYDVGNRDNVMRARVTVRKAGIHVSGASVAIIDGESGARFALEENGGNERYDASIAGGYRRRIELEIRSGNDNLTGRLEGPGAHLIEAPAHGSRVELSGGDKLDVHWQTEDGLAADEVRVDLDQADYTTTLNEDRGRDEVPMATLRAGSEKVEVERRNRVVLTGGDGQSTMQISYEVENGFEVMN